MIAEPNKEEGDFSAKVKLALRDVGNELLLSTGDSVSLILPVRELSKDYYRLSFQNHLSTKPGLVVTQVKASFAKLDLPKFYRVEVIQCTDQEVAYSYEIRNDSAHDIIPCVGRDLPLDCYDVEIKFIQATSPVATRKHLGFGLLFGVMLMVAFVFTKRKKPVSLQNPDVFIVIGNTKFDQLQSLLLVNGEEVSLTSKECELLAIFAENINQVVTREVLTKRVWEDHNVFVGRSLDTYISRLRNKLKSDPSIKIINAHGIGYRLEVLSDA